MRRHFVKGTVFALFKTASLSFGFSSVQIVSVSFNEFSCHKSKIIELVVRIG